MCGNVGIAGKIGIKEEKIFRTLLILDSLRGEHSTGIASVTSAKDVVVAKSVGDPFILLDSRDGDKIFKQSNRVLIGHNRYATTGKINRRNAHPFEFENVVGCHNGTLTNKHTLSNHNLFDVDSEAIYDLIDKEGVIPATAQLQGAWALVWYDKKAESINFLRNKERTLFACYSKDKSTIFWASEIWMLNVALSREGIEHGDIFFFTEDKHYEIAIDFVKGSLHELTEEDCEGAPTFVYNVKKKESYTTSFPASKTSYSVSAEYLGSEREFEITSVSKDEFGAEFLYVVDTKDKQHQTRLYLHKDSYLKTKVGYRFLGKVLSAKKGVVTVFYKVGIKSAVYKAKETQLPAQDKNGNTITQQDHDKYYHTCSWCSSPVEFGEKGAYYSNKESGVFCSNCASDTEVSKYF